MASVPAHVGMDVLFRSMHLNDDAELRSARIVSVPKLIWEGHPNVDAEGNPICVDLLVFDTSGVHTMWRIRHQSLAKSAGENYWVEFFPQS